jgi:hypothetical protein
VRKEMTAAAWSRNPKCQKTSQSGHRATFQRLFVTPPPWECPLYESRFTARIRRYKDTHVPHRFGPLQAKGVDQGRERGRLLPSAWVIEEESRERLAPILQDADELSARQLRFDTLI